MKETTIKTIGWTLFGITTVIMYFGMFWTMAWSNAEINTNHNITFNADNETRDALKYMSQIREYEIRENDLYCENKLLNQSLFYENEMYKIIRWYEVEQFKFTSN